MLRRSVAGSAVNQLDGTVRTPEKPGMPTASWILSENYAGLQAQGLGLAERAGLPSEPRVLTPRAPWRHIPAAFWPAPLRVVGMQADTAPPLLIGVGGVAASVGAAWRRRGHLVVHVQHPRMDPGKFDLLVVNRHDRLTGANVVVTRTALHRVTPEMLARAAVEWAPRLVHLPRPLVAVLVGGSNGRFRLEAPEAAKLGGEIAAMMRRDRVGVMLTPSRRTAPAARAALAAAICPLGGMVWDMQGDNPYFGMLALADAIIVTVDSVSMVSEAVATAAPVMLAQLPGNSRRIGEFAEGLVRDGRVRWFDGRLQDWKVAPLDDTAEAAAELRRRLGF